jgi:hypothetical protein
MEEDSGVMGNINFGLAIEIDTKTASRAVMQGVANKMNENIQRGKDTIGKIIGEKFVVAVKETPEYASLITDRGQLRLEFGIANQEYVMARILSRLKECFGHEYQRVKVTDYDKVSGQFRVFFNKGSFEFLYSEAAFLSSNSSFKKLPPGKFKTEKGDTINWLEWLLEEGTKPIIYDYSVLFGEYGPHVSRTGGAIMIPRVDGTSWHVPDIFAGTVDDNWLTRVLREFEPVVADLVTKLVTRGLHGVATEI